MTTRREFIKKSALGTAGLAIGGMGFSAHSYRSIIGSNDRINVASIGLGGPFKEGGSLVANGGGLGIGTNYVDKICNLKNQCNIQLVSLCDVDERFFARNNKVVYDKTGIKPKNEWDMRRVFDDKSVDVVFLTPPNHWHALSFIWAAQAGKHIWTEKPLGHNISEGRIMLEATRKYKPIVQVGQYRRAIDNAQAAIKLLHEGGIGDVYLAQVIHHKRRPSFGIAANSTPPDQLHYDMWLGPAAEQPYNERKLHYNWHFHWNTGNGDIANQGVHFLDIARWGLNKNEHPVSVYSSGGIYGWKSNECSQETPDTQNAVYTYADGKIIEFLGKGHYTNGVASQNIHIGVVFYGTEGYLEFDYHSTWRAFKKEGKEPFASRNTPDPNRQDLLMVNFVEALRSRDVNKLNCPISDGHYSSTLAHLGNISYLLGRSLKFNGKNEIFERDAEANAMLIKEYRAPYKLPKI